MFIKSFSNQFPKPDNRIGLNNSELKINIFKIGMYLNWNEDCDIFLPPSEDPSYYDPPNNFVDIVDFQIFIGKWLDENNFSSCDFNGHQINDPWPTPFNTGGFDLDAVGVINARPR